MLAAVEASGLFPPGELGEIEAMLSDHFAGTLGPDHVWLTADEAGQSVGVAYYAPERMTQGTWNLYLIALHPGHQGKGRGAAILRHVEQALAARGERILLVETSGLPGFERTRNFYRKCGYDEEARIRDFYQAGEDKVVFRKALLPRPVGAPGGSDPDQMRGDSGPMTTTIQATPAELSHVRGLLRAQFEDHAITLDEAAFDRGLIRMLQDPSLGRILLAIEGDHAIGLAVLAFTWTLEHGGLVAWLDELYVVPARREGGVGRHLLQEALRTAREAGCAAVELEVESDHARAENLYAREGFERLPRRRWVRSLRG